MDLQCINLVTNITISNLSNLRNLSNLSNLSNSLKSLKLPGSFQSLVSIDSILTLFVSYNFLYRLIRPLPRYITLRTIPQNSRASGFRSTHSTSAHGSSEVPWVKGFEKEGKPVWLVSKVRICLHLAILAHLCIQEQTTRAGDGPHSSSVSHSSLLHVQELNLRREAREKKKKGNSSNAVAPLNPSM